MVGTPLVDFDRADLRDALSRIPARFHDLARQYAEQIAVKINTQYDSDPRLIDNVRETTVQCALNGFSFVRWYLLFTPERAEAAERAWSEGGIPEFCLHMRELHQAERALLVSGYGNAKQEDVDARLSALHEVDRFTLVAASHGFAAERIKNWARGAGVSYVHFPLASDRESISTLKGQYYALLDKLAPRAVCILVPDSPAMLLAECAAQKKIAVVSTPERSAAPSPRAEAPKAATPAQPPSNISDAGAAPKQFQFKALMQGRGMEP